MEIIDNITTLLGDNLKKILQPDSKLKMIDLLHFIFTLPTPLFIERQPGLPDLLFNHVATFANGAVRADDITILEISRAVP